MVNTKKLYKVIDNDGFNTLSWTHTYPATLDDISQAMHNHHKVYGKGLAVSRLAYLPSYGAPKLVDLLNVYNLKLEEVKETK